MAWCCSSNNHPNDVVCEYIYMRDQCDVGGSSGPVYLVQLDNYLNDLPGEPTFSQLLMLTNALSSEEFFDEALATSQYLARIVPPGDFASLTKVYQAQSDIYSQLGNVPAANAAMDLAANLAASARLHNNLDAVLNQPIG